MKFANNLIGGRLIKRYKRFLADVKLANGELITVHCANTGAMTGCQPENARIWLSESDNPKRKYPYSWELVELENKALASINTSLTNRVAEEAIKTGAIKELSGFTRCLKEVTYGDERSRIDLLLEYEDKKCFIEIKHVTLVLSPGTGAFPDAVTKRGQKHLRELISQVKAGHRAVMLFIIMRTDVDVIQPADDIDAEYGTLLRRAASEGVEVLAYKAKIDLQEIRVTDAVPVKL
ncbi:MAG: DNA/RNA nuclease SfsA [Gammaproteobacteria bacterium]|nr:DNA/RNA nuclease SfsA [Gammaproteobacteria bacterium]